MTAPRMGLAEWLMLILLSVLWGGAFLFGKMAVADLRPFTVVLARVALAAAALALVVRAAGLRMPGTPAAWRPFFVLGLLNNLVPFSLIFWGQTQIASGLAAILNATTPLFGVVLAHALTPDERLTAPRLAGVLLGIGGVAVIVGPEALGGAGTAVLAQFAVLGAALSYGCAGIYSRRFRGTPPLVTSAGQVTASALMILPVALLVDRPWEGAMPGAVTWGALLGLALLGTAGAYVLYFRIMARAGATNAMLVTLLIPVSALLLGAVVLGEAVEPRQVAGMALIGLGLAVIDGRPLGWVRRLAPAS
ncbi:DMT family transporter [Azospirillum sp. TSO22-1]|uniref:DMT family transporter n=1 Tax=Azospirillum sp. TSO22-1 TaxID=716789 RepID=UPI000D60A206|nr:DMT family transporter [Azospirillum sp. TSO22-1]PWC52864.1 ABC transporter permease [Azospirillum sp. TSO22-1]